MESKRKVSKYQEIMTEIAAIKRELNELRQEINASKIQEKTAEPVNNSQLSIVDKKQISSLIILATDPIIEKLRQVHKVVEAIVPEINRLDERIAYQSSDTSELLTAYQNEVYKRDRGISGAGGGQLKIESGGAGKQRRDLLRPGVDLFWRDDDK